MPGRSTFAKAVKDVRPERKGLSRPLWRGSEQASELGAVGTIPDSATLLLLNPPCSRKPPGQSQVLEEHSVYMVGQAWNSALVGGG